MTRSDHTGDNGAMALHVVAAAIVRDGLVLAAHRTRPAVGWEFPGGKVESGESEAAALAREIEEELGATIEVGSRLADVTDGRIRLVLYAATVETGEPQAGADHDAVRWLAPADLDGLEWLVIDRQLLDLARQLLR
jgi:8-oxo-dGTP diphosphatase